MNIGTFLVADAQATPLEQPIETGLDDVAKLTEPAAVFCISMGDQGLNPLLAKGLTDFGFGIVCSICQEKFHPSSARSASSPDSRSLVDDVSGRLRVVDISGRMVDRPRNPGAFRQQVAFRTRLAAIRWVRTGVRPPKTALTEQLSSTPTSRSNSPACPSSSSSNCQILIQTPACCQSRSRRQHVIPQPQPISSGRYSHGVPVFRIKRIPVKQLRSETRGRPPLGFRRSGGNNGWIRSHNSSGNNGLAMSSSLTGGECRFRSEK